MFSSAGIGCYRFKLEGFECVATNELIAKRLELQRINKKYKYKSGYICSGITEDAMYASDVSIEKGILNSKSI